MCEAFFSRASSTLLGNAKPGELPSNVKKTVLFGGSGPTGPWPEGSRLTFDFQCAPADDESQVIDDTVKLKKPMELIIGKKFKLEIWELMLHTLRLNERSKFVVPKAFLHAYPVVSKAFRDTVYKKETHHAHRCCGMQNEVSGYPDLDELMKTPKDLIFTMEITKVENPGDYEEENWQLSPEKKLASVPDLKESGNKLFNEGDIKGALAKYHQAIGRIEELLLREKPGCEEYVELEVMKVPLLLNYSLCLMKDKEFYEAKTHLSSVLKIEPDNVKGLFRKGKCEAAVGNFEEARSLLEQALKLNPGLKKDVDKELEVIGMMQKEKNKSDQQTFKNLFAPS